MQPYAKNVVVTLSLPDLSDLSHAQKDEQIVALFGQLQALIDQKAVLLERIKAPEGRLALNSRPSTAWRLKHWWCIFCMFESLGLTEAINGVAFFRTLLGNAAHPMLQYLNQDAGQAIEDAVVSHEALRFTRGDMQTAFQ